MSVLLAYGSRILSMRAPSGAVSGWLSVGTALSGTVPQHNDGVMGLATKANEITVAFAVDLGASLAPDLVGFFNHNISSGIVRVQGSDINNFSSLIVDVVATAAQPNFWKDLRAITPRTARYWRGLVTSNANAVKLGEFVVATALAIDSFQWDYDEIRDYIEYTRGTTDYGVLVRQKQGFQIRAKQVRWVGPDTLAETLQAVSDDVGRRPGPVVLVPDDTVNDIWFLDWTDGFERGQVIDNRQEVKILLQEQSPGVL